MIAWQILDTALVLIWVYPCFDFHGSTISAVIISRKENILVEFFFKLSKGLDQLIWNKWIERRYFTESCKNYMYSWPCVDILKFMLLINAYDKVYLPYWNELTSVYTFITLIFICYSARSNILALYIWRCLFIAVCILICFSFGLPSCVTVTKYANSSHHECIL